MFTKLPSEIRLNDYQSYYNSPANISIVKRTLFSNLVNGVDVFVRFENESRLGSIAKLKVVPNQYTANSVYLTPGVTQEEAAINEIRGELNKNSTSGYRGETLYIPYRCSLMAYWEDTAGKNRSCVVSLSSLIWLTDYVGKTEYKFFKLPKDKKEPPIIKDTLDNIIEIGNVIAGKAGSGTRGDFDICIVERITPAGTLMCKSILREDSKYNTGIRMYGQSSVKIDGNTMDMILMKRLSV